MALVCLAQENFSDAARYLKAALNMEDDGTRAWISAEALFGNRVAERTRSHGLKLWNWLSERPLSSDRLLLAGTFPKLRGHNGHLQFVWAVTFHLEASNSIKSQLRTTACNWARVTVKCVHSPQD